MTGLEYMIINDGAGFILYRKLLPGEERWYRDELYKLRYLRGELWLYLKKCNEGEIMSLLD